MKKDKFSVLILTRNRAKLLARNLRSVAKQTRKSNEIVVIDNNSTDNTRLVVKKLESSLPLRYFKTGLSGFARLYNFGIQKTRGNFVCFLDDDCLAHKNWLEEMIKTQKKYPKSVIQGNTYSLPKDNLYAEIMGDHYQNWLKSNLINENELKTLDNKNLCVPKEIFQKFGGFSEKQNIGSEDIEFGIRLRKKGVKIIFSPKALAWHYERDNLKDFIKQHYRIAQAESTCDRLFKAKKEIGLFPRKKTLLNLISANKRFWSYLAKGDLKKAIKLPLIYLILMKIRIYGYLFRK